MNGEGEDACRGDEADEGYREALGGVVLVAGA